MLAIRKGNIYFCMTYITLILVQFPNRAHLLVYAAHNLQNDLVEVQNAVSILVRYSLVLGMIKIKYSCLRFGTMYMQIPDAWTQRSYILCPSIWVFPQNSTSG